MEEYYIYYLNDSYLPFAKMYPQIIHQMALRQKSDFERKQNKAVFKELDSLNKQIDLFFKQRSDYLHIRNVHYIRNKITGESSLLIFYRTFAYLKCSENFYIMKNIVLQCDDNYVILKK